MDIKNLGCINPYTGLLTSKKVTNVENRRELCKFMCNLDLVRPVSLEDLMGGMGKPLNLAEKTSINKRNNSIDLAQGAKVTVEGGFVLTVGKEIVEISGGDLYNRKASEKAAEMASALIIFASECRRNSKYRCIQHARIPKVDGKCIRSNELFWDRCLERFYRKRHEIQQK